MQNYSGILSENEEKIIAYLRMGVMRMSNVTDISRAINTPRTTVKYTLLKLKRKNLVHRLHLGRRLVWSLENANKINNKCINLFKRRPIP